MLQGTDGDGDGDGDYVGGSQRKSFVLAGVPTDARLFTHGCLLPPSVASPQT